MSAKIVMPSNKSNRHDQDFSSASASTRVSENASHHGGLAERLSISTSHSQQSESSQLSRAILKARRLLKVSGSRSELGSGSGSRASVKTDTAAGTSAIFISSPKLLSTSSSFPADHSSGLSRSSSSSQRLVKSFVDTTTTNSGESTLDCMKRSGLAEKAQCGVSSHVNVNYGSCQRNNTLGQAEKRCNTQSLDGIPPPTPEKGIRSVTTARYNHVPNRQRDLGQMKLLSKTDTTGTYEYTPPKGSEYVPPRRRGVSEDISNNNGQNQYSWDRRPTCPDEYKLRQDILMGSLGDKLMVKAPTPPHARELAYKNKSLPPLPPPPPKAVGQLSDIPTPPTSYRDETFLPYGQHGTLRLNATYKHQPTPLEIMLPSPSSLPPKDELLARLETAAIAFHSPTSISTTGSYETSPSFLLSNSSIRPPSASSQSVYSDQDVDIPSETKYRKDSVPEYISESFFRRLSCSKNSNLDRQKTIFHPPRTPSNCGTEMSNMPVSKRVVIWEDPIESQLQQAHNGRPCGNSTKTNQNEYESNDQRKGNKDEEQQQKSANTTFRARYETISNIHTINGKTYLVKGHEKIPMRLIRPDVVYANHSHCQNNHHDNDYNNNSMSEYTSNQKIQSSTLCSSFSSTTVSESDYDSSQQDPHSTFSSVYSNFIMDDIDDDDNVQDKGGAVVEAIHYPTLENTTSNLVLKDGAYIYEHNINGPVSLNHDHRRDEDEDVYRGEDVSDIYDLYTTLHDSHVNRHENEDDDVDNTMYHHTRQLSLINPDIYDDDDEDDIYGIHRKDGLKENEEEEAATVAEDEDSVAWTFVGDLQRQNEDLTARVMQLEHALRVQQLKQESLLLPLSSSTMKQQTSSSEVLPLQLKPLNSKSKTSFSHHHQSSSIDVTRNNLVAANNGGGSGKNGQVIGASLGNNNHYNGSEEWRWDGLRLQE